MGGGSGCARYCQKLTVVSVSRDTGSTRDDGWIAVVGQPAGNPHRAPHLFLIVGAGGDPGDREIRARFEAAWLPRWGDQATTRNGFLPVRGLATAPGLALRDIPEAIERGEIQAMYIEGTIAGRDTIIDPRLQAALAKLKFLVVADTYDSPLAKMADVALPVAMSLEKDGTFTSFDRTIQRIRAAVPAMGEAKPHLEAVALLSRRLGYDMNSRHPNQVMAEIARLVPTYAGVTYARLERDGVNTPVASFADAGTPMLGSDNGSGGGLRLQLIPASS